MLNLFSPRRLSWGSSTGGQEKVWFEKLSCCAYFVIGQGSIISYQLNLYCAGWANSCGSRITSNRTCWYRGEGSSLESSVSDVTN